ncbi:WD40 repeat-like protein [Ramaria rubella]|nr:WD40 repeat-like protein [Ramaria rubella]
MSTQHQEDPEQEVGDEFIEPTDVLAELEDDGDILMDEDDLEVLESGDPTAEGFEDKIVYEDSSISHFGGHEGSVFAVSLHPSQPLAISGGEDDLGYIWNLEDGEVVVKLTGHTDSVTSVGWSYDGELASTGGMDGRIRVWRRVKRAASEGKNAWKTWEFLTELSGPDEIMWLNWHPKGSVLLAGSNDSTVWLWQLPSGNTMQVLASHVGPVNAGVFTPDGKKVLTGSECLLLTTPTSDSPLLKLTPADARFALEGGITALAVNASNTLAVVGGSDGGVRVVSLGKGDVVGSLEGHKEDESIEGVAWMEFAGTEVALTGGTDGKVCVWDLGTMRLRTTLEHPDAVTSLNPHPVPSSHLLTTSCADKTLRTWDVRTGTVVREHKGHHGPILGASLGIAEGRVVVVSAGDDGVCLVFAAE